MKRVEEGAGELVTLESRERYARAQIGKLMGTSAKRVAAWCAGLYCRPRSWGSGCRRDLDVGNTWEYPGDGERRLRGSL